jgi:ribokinase
LGAEPQLLSIIGDDNYRDAIEREFSARKITVDLFPIIETAPQSVVLYDEACERRICLDLKDIQEARLPSGVARSAIKGVDMAAVCNVNFSRELIGALKSSGACVGINVHAVSSVEDPFNREFMESTDLFLSNERIAGSEGEFLNQLAARCRSEAIVIGMGTQGALMYERKDSNVTFHPARYSRQVVNTAGARNALFSCFLFFCGKTRSPYAAIENATYFASYKTGEKGAANGFLTECELKEMRDSLPCQ